MSNSNIEEITNLFARLATDLENLSPTDGKEDHSQQLICNLNQSLNSTEHSTVRVLDTVLSLMCFKAPDVFDSVIKYSVKTIVTVLSSSITCKVLRYGKEEILQVGGSILVQDSMELIEACADILGKLKGDGKLAFSLFYAVARVALFATRFQFELKLTHILDIKSIDRRNLDISKLFCHLPSEFSVKAQEIPLRLLCWYLDPLILKHDISKILLDFTKRPFLCLNMEFYNREELRSVVTCLVVSPFMFIEARALLHKWFIETGLASVLELQIELVSIIVDIISRPIWWAIPNEVGSKLPFCQAYFPSKHQLLTIFAGPLSCARLLDLHHRVNNLNSHAKGLPDSISRQVPMKIMVTDPKSVWAMAMNFPNWFYFATVLLFTGKSIGGCFHFDCTFQVAKADPLHYKVPTCSVAASKYIAWLLNPTDKSRQDILVNCLIRISTSFISKQFNSDEYNKSTTAYQKKLKKPKLNEKVVNASLMEYHSETIQFWLKEFHEVYTNHCDRAVNFSTSCDALGSSDVCLQRNMLFRRLLLGILIGCSENINEDGCELLLNYAATGRIFQWAETPNAASSHTKWYPQFEEDLITWTESYCKKVAVAGALLVFHLTDVIESISASIFDTEDIRVRFICQVKLKVGKYLLKCAERLLQPNIDEDELFLSRDLCKRLVTWRRQEQVVSPRWKVLSDAIDTLCNNFSSLRDTV